jgi:hypothetical protein
MIGDWIDKVDYPQLPANNEDELAAFFSDAEFDRHGTLNEDRTIRITSIFFNYVADQFLMASHVRSRKIKNINRDNYVSIRINTSDVPFNGALIYGIADLDYEDVIMKRISIFERKLSWEHAEKYAWRIADKWDCVIIRIAPKRITSFDYTKGL